MTVKMEYKGHSDQHPPRVSVVIPAYNQAQFLADAIQSVLAQTYQDYELIVIDDGSTDETPAVAMQFGAPGDGTNPVRYIWQSNQGLAGARNTGILRARGEFIALLDSDDQWLPTYLQKMVSLADEHPEGTVYYCQVRYMDSDNREMPQQPSPRVESPDRLYKSLLRTNFLVPSTILMRRETLLQAGLFDPIFRRLQDWELWLRLLREGKAFIGTPERLVRYRLHGSSLSTDPAGGRQAVKTMVEKLFGVDDGHWSDWSDEKRRAYGGAYRYYALSSIQYEGNWPAATDYLAVALQIDPSLASDLDLFYEMALGAQPLGLRDTAYNFDLKRNARTIEQLLAKIFHPPVPAGLTRIFQEAFGTAYYALGLVAYNHGQLHLSRRFFWMAVRYRPELIGKWRMLTALIKSFIGRSTLLRIRRLRSLLRGNLKASEIAGAFSERHPDAAV